MNPLNAIKARKAEYHKIYERINAEPTDEIYKDIPSKKPPVTTEISRISMALKLVVFTAWFFAIIYVTFWAELAIDRYILFSWVPITLIAGGLYYLTSRLDPDHREENQKRKEHNALVEQRRIDAYKNWEEKNRIILSKIVPSKVPGIVQQVIDVGGMWSIDTEGVEYTTFQLDRYKEYVIKTIIGRYESTIKRLEYYYTEPNDTNFTLIDLADIPLEDYQDWTIRDFLYDTAAGSDVWYVIQHIATEIRNTSDEKIFTQPQKLPQVTKAAFQNYQQEFFSKVDTSDFFLRTFNAVVPFNARQKHTYVLGTTGSGKSELMKLFVYHDLQHSSSALILDPHDKLTLEISRLKHFKKNPEQLLYLTTRLYEKVGASFHYNPLEHNYHRLPHGQRMTNISNKTDRLLEAFSAIMQGDFTEPQQDIIVHSSLLLMLQKDRHLGDLMRLIHPTLEPPKELLAPLYELPDIPEYETLKAYFRDIFFEDYTKQSKNKLFSRFNRVFGMGALRRILYTPKSSFDLTTALESGKTVCIGLTKKGLGDKGIYILGAFLVSELNHFAYSRPSEDEEIRKRKQVFAYIDEFQNFVHESYFKRMLVETRKFKVSFMLAHHGFAQLSTKLRDTIIGNTSVKFCGKGNDISTLAERMGFDKKEIKRHEPTLKNGRFLYQADGITPQVVQAHKILAVDKADPTYYMTSTEFKEVLQYQIQNYYTTENNDGTKRKNIAASKPSTPPNKDDGFTPNFHDIDI